MTLPKEDRMRRALLVVLTVLAASSPVLAGKDKELSKIESLIHQRFPNLEFQEVTKSPVPGLYEIHAGTNVIYVDKPVEHLIFGAIYDTNGRNLTDETRQELYRKMAQRLSRTFPSKTALHIKGKKPTVFLVTDPDCPYCRRELSELLSKGADLYVIFVTGHRYSYPHAVYVLTAKDKRKALEDVISGKLDDDAKVQEIFRKLKGKDKDRVDALLSEWDKWARKNGINSVPAIIVPSRNFYVEGYRPEVISQLYPVNLKEIKALEKAPVVVGSGKGRKIVVVTDPTCPFCALACNKLRHYAKEGKATFYVYFLPIHGQASYNAIADILNAPKNKRAKILAEFFEHKRQASGKPMTPEANKEFQEEMKVVNQLGVTGTPTFFDYETGKKIVGARIPEVEKLINGGKK